MKGNIESSVSFYNAIAAEYNSQMTDNDARAREQIHQLFKQWVGKGNILDFGGGTGLDLAWLLLHDYRVFFLEPSVSMREIAKRNIPENKHPIFIEENIDFNNWSSDHLPFKEKMNGVITNFAVLNCIENVHEFFNKIALVCERGSHVLITIIYPKLGSLLNNYSVLKVLKLLFTDSLIIKNRYKEVYHNTYIHSIQSLKKAAGTNFIFLSLTPIQFSGFCTLVFVKK